jgi:hypothetical protein
MSMWFKEVNAKNGGMSNMFAMPNQSSGYTCSYLPAFNKSSYRTSSTTNMRAMSMWLKEVYEKDRGLSNLHTMSYNLTVNIFAY